MNRTTPGSWSCSASAKPTTSRPHGPSSMLTLGTSLRNESASSDATSRHSPAVFGAAYAAIVNRPLGVTTHTALGTPISVSSTCTWPASGIGISTEPRLSRPSSAADGSSKSSMSKGPSGSSTSVTSAGPSTSSSPSLRFPNAMSQTRMSAGGSVATVATGSVCQAGLVERRHLDQLGQLYALHQKLGDPVSAMHDDQRLGVEVDQGYLDLTAVSGVDRARAVDDRKTHARSQTRSRMHQTDHAVRDGDGDAGRHQCTLTRRQFDV